jgi:hypothetical protein
MAKDLAGNSMKTTHMFSFTTGNESDTKPPFIVSTNPSDGQKDVDTSLKILITFSEAMDKTSTEAAVSIVPGIITGMNWNQDGTDLTVIINLDEGKTYSVTISTKAKDLAGNLMAFPYTFSFTTKSSGTPPSGIDMMIIIPVVIVMTIAVVVIVGYIVMKKKKKKQSEPENKEKPETK